LGELFLGGDCSKGVCRGGEGVIVTVGVALSESAAPQEGQKRLPAGTRMSQAGQVIAVGVVYSRSKMDDTFPLTEAPAAMKSPREEDRV
jgi:hypothetical protein